MLNVIATIACAGDPQLELPLDPRQAVIEFSYVDGQQPPQLEVAVFANGRIWVRVGEGSIWGEMSAAEVQGLVRELLETHCLAETTTDLVQSRLEQASRSTGLTCRVANAGDTLVRIQTKDREYVCRGHAVGLLSHRFPQVECVQKLAAAQRRLENVRAVVLVGGRENAERLAGLARRQVESEFGESVAVSCEHLATVRSFADGGRYCQFILPSPGRPDRIVSLFESPGEAPRVSVVPDQAGLR